MEILTQKRTAPPSDLGAVPDLAALAALMDEGRPAEAERLARDRLAQQPNAGILWKVLAVAQMRQGKGALPALKRTVQLLPGDAESHANLAAAWIEQRRWDEAIVTLHRVIELEPGNLSALLDTAAVLRALGRACESVPLYRRVLDIDPRALAARNDLGNVLLELGEYAAALDCYRQAVSLAPNDAKVRANLANALRRLGRISDAVEASRQAIALDPQLPEPHDTLGLALAAQGLEVAAMASYRRALELNPRSVQTLNNLGNALRDGGELESAEQCFRRALALEPRSAVTHGNLGNVQLDGGFLESAAASYSRALELEPDTPSGHLQLSMVLRRLGLAGEAERSCRTALSKHPDFPAALSFLGELHADRGRFADAEALFRRAITLDRDFPSAWCGIALNRKMTLDDTDWVQGASALLAKPLPLRHTISLHHALGKYFDDVCRYDQAFAHHREANELSKRYGARHSGARFDREKLRRRVHAIIGQFDALRVHAGEPGAVPSECPVLIVGMPRSGTTLCEQILASHPDVYGAGELTFWDRAAAKCVAAGRSGDAGPLARGYLDLLRAQSPQALRVVDKMPANFMHLGLIHAALPGARIIHMRRDPIDTCLSIYFQSFANTHPYAHDLEDLADYYQEYARLMAHWRNVLPAASLLEVNYEDLVADQEAWSRRLVSFLGLPWDARCLEFHRSDRVVITTSKWQVRQKMHPASAGRWRHYRQFIGPLQRL